MLNGPCWKKKEKKEEEEAGLKSKYSEPAFIICSYWENKKTLEILILKHFQMIGPPFNNLNSYLLTMYMFVKASSRIDALTLRQA